MLGCGTEAPTFTGSDEHQVAATVRTVTEAMEEGDGDLACSLISERGQEVLVRIFRDEMPEADAGSCEEAVETIGEDDLDIGDPQSGIENVTLYRGGGETRDTAQVNCRTRGAFILRRTDDGWRAGAPYCVD